MSARRPLSLLALLALTAATARAEDAAALMARDQVAAGGAKRWEGVTSLQLTGTLHAGGLDGTFRTVRDFTHLRTLTEYRLGPVEGAEGYDGRQGWSRDPGGEVAVLDAPEVHRRARSQAWLETHGYWFPARLPVRYGDVTVRELEGRRYAVVEATPKGGDTLSLWFDATTHHLARVEQKQDQDTATTLFGDWREVEGMTLPFHIVTTLTDAAGRTDPRRSTELRIERITPDVAVTAAGFAVPQMPPTASIASPAGYTRVPFELINNHIHVDGAIDGKPARFIVDTGGVNLLTPEAAKKFGLVAEGKLAARGCRRTDGRPRARPRA